jgi:c-di-GMP-related signal transduction protein
MIDVLTSRPMEEALSALPLSVEARDALLGKPNRLGQILKLVEMLERGRWTLADQVVGSLRLTPSRISTCYAEAMQWGSQSRGLAA